MKKELLHRLRGYSALAGATLAAAASADAQIQYTDISPDTTFSGNATFDIDLNNDQVMDFRITMSSSASTFTTTSGSTYTRYGSMYINNLASNSIVLYTSSYADTIPTGASIKGSGMMWGTWNHKMAYGNKTVTKAGSNTNTVSATSGAFNNTKDKYLGLRIKVGNDTLYGWVRVDVGDHATYATIKDYAVNLTPGEPIKAGQKVATSVAEPKSTGTLSAFAANGNITIKINEELLGSNFQIIDLTGKVVNQGQLNSNQETISMNGQPSGIYFVRVGTHSEKIFIQ